MGELKRAAIIGTGTMGPGMGAVLARAGIQTALYDVSADALERAKTGVAMAEGALERLEAVKADGGGITYESDLAAALAGCQLVIEAAPERLDLKQELFAEFEKHVTPDAILASNTSGIPITKIAADLQNPERVVGMHWSNPPHMIPMIEVIPGDKTSQATVDATVKLVQDIGYHAVVEREVPGFVENRILYAILRECLDLVDRGIVDAAGPRHERALGHRLQARGDRPDGAARHGRPRHLQGRRHVPEPRPVDLGRGLLDDPRPDREGPARHEDRRRPVRLHPEQINELRASRVAKLIAVRKALEA